MHSGSFFEEHRNHLTMLGYRMLGTMAEAEDMVQETYLRWTQAGQPKLASPKAWLTRTCTHLCIDQIKAARRNRETYVGVWLPEPMVTGRQAGEVDDTLSMALLMAIQRLRPAERAAFLLHDVFGYEFDEVGLILDRQGAACRQLAARARKRLVGQEPQAKAPTETDSRSIERVTNAFFEAVRSGDLGNIRAVLASDAVLYSDGGGKASAVRHPLEGGDAVARFFERIFRQTRSRYQVADVWINGAPGKLLFEGEKLATVFQMVVADGQVTVIYAQRNPDKMAGLPDALASQPDWVGSRASL